MPNELIPIDDDELLFRRISVRSGWLQAGEMRAKGIRVVPQPDVAGNRDDSHAELPQIRVDTKKSDDVLVLKQQLAELACCREVYGPFPTRHG